MAFLKSTSDPRCNNAENDSRVFVNVVHYEAARQALFCIVLLGPVVRVVKTASQRITQDCEFNLSVWSESPADLICYRDGVW